MTDLLIYHYGYVQGTAQGGSDRLSRDIRLLERAVADDPSNGYLCAKLGLSYAHGGRLDEGLHCLSRVILELEPRQLPPEMLRTVLVTLGRLALQRGDYRLATDCAEASNRIPDCGGFLSMLAARLLGLGHIGSAQNHLRQARLMLCQGNEGISGRASSQGVKHLRQARSDLRLALGNLQLLLSYPELRSTAAAETRLTIERLHKLLDSPLLSPTTRPGDNWTETGELNLALRQTVACLAPEPLAEQAQDAGSFKAAQTLRLLLDAEDIAAALEHYSSRLDNDLLALVRLNAHTARCDGKQDLACLLDNLADYVTHALQSSGQPEVVLREP